MPATKKLNMQKKWIALWSFIAFLTLIIIMEQIPAPLDASASKQSPDAALFDLEDIYQEVQVVKNLVYSNKKDSLLDIYYPKTGGQNLPVILWIHGGGYVGGSKDSRQEYGMALAHAGYVVANIDYALAPEQKYPGPIIQANEALNYLQLHAAKYGGDMDKVFIGGDSAGAQISSQVAAVISNNDLSEAMQIVPAVQAAQLQGALLFCGLFNMKTVRATEFPNIDGFLNTYTGVEPFETFEDIDQLSTVNQITSAYPPVFITAGDADPLVSQSVEFAETLETTGIAVTSVFFNGTDKELKHEFQYALDTLEAQETLAKALDFLFVNSN
ncbi:alpha/beta hydrolase [Planococcus shenhongbingii]|uniref:Alpha/beta hydrolase n=1 Tax=Planococcus shenhongbingii TaxID=3058398 RepID=A0ABT8NFU6_9BACL|nr:MULTISPECIES: alpha/beta hydrolase [unclassified Planococcus (in: firmicutes)]MDN7246776.1 alpha/beta hydrolase [Planococcus sp. N017]WKA58866.1 alpha/beta hydrolase [Planococcus sp. N016]